MFCSKRVAVVVPCYNVQSTIADVVSDMPAFVDSILVIDDASTDETLALLEDLDFPRVTIIRHQTNKGVGASIASGYREALRQGAAVTAVMAGDGQMNPDELESLIAPVLNGEADYAKGNRFSGGQAFRCMPLSRYVGNVALSVLNKPVSGYWSLFDSQCGYTAISSEMLQRLDLDAIYPRYGVPNDLLAKLHCLQARVIEVPVTPIYPRAHSQMNPFRVPFSVAYLLLRLYARRMGGRLQQSPRIKEDVADALR